MKRGTCRPAVRDILEQLLIAKADRTFLWIKLVLPSFEARRVLLPSDVETIASQLPLDLASLYRHLLSSIPKDDQAIAAKMLRVLVASDRPLTSDEFGIIMTISPEHMSVSALAAHQLLFDEDSARAALGPLVRVYGSTIELVHLSLKDYLISLSNLPQDKFATTFGVDLIRDKLALFSACSLYLALDEFSQEFLATRASSHENSPADEAEISSSGSPTYCFDLYDEPMFKDGLVLEEEEWARMTNEYKLFDYAAVHWAKYFSDCNMTASEEDHMAVLALYEAGTTRRTSWFRYFWFRNMHPEPFPAAIDKFMIVSFFGHSKTLIQLLHSTGPSDSLALTRALYWAAREGQAVCMKTLLQQTYIDVQAPLVNSQTSLSVAAQFGHFECISILSEDLRVDVNAQDGRGCTPLSLAVSNNHTEVVALLLEHKKVLVELTDHSLNSPLHWAVAGGSCSIAERLLLDSRINKNHLDKRGRNALSWAAEYGVADVAQLLVRHQRLGIDQKDVRGRTPLSYAAEHGHLDVLKIILRSGLVNLLDEDFDGRNAHSWAAAQPKTSVLRYLIDKCRKGADIADHDGWTPLAWALDPPGYPNNILALLNSGAVDVHHKDGVRGRTTLIWAASYGYTQIVRHLLGSNGIELDCRDIDGRTPLSEAAASGAIDIVRLLIDTNVVDVNSRDNNGRTPLSWAAREGRVEVASMLLLNPAIDEHAKDNSGQTPLDVAKKFGREDVLLVLQRRSVS